MNYGMKHPSHSGSFVRQKGGWGAYHKWCVENGFARIMDDGRGNKFPMFILKPIKTEKKQGRNDPCACGSGKKFKRCCI